VEYILQLHKSKINKVKLSEESLFTLYQYSKNQFLSTYQVQRLLKNTKFQSEYKNVHKKIQNLLALGLIEKLPRTLDRIEHGAIYYKLTTTGVFYLILNSDLSFVEGLEIIKYYWNDSFFKIFVYPYFKPETLYNLKLHNIIFYIQRFFSRLGNRIKELLDDLEEIDKNNELFTVHAIWNLASIDKKEEVMSRWGIFILNLQNRLKYEWIDYDIKVKRIDNHTLTFEKDNRAIYLKLNESKTNLIVSNDKKELYRFPVQKRNKFLLIGELIPQTVEHEIEYRSKRFKIWGQEMIEDLAVSIVKYSVPIKYSSDITEMERLEDIKTLSSDTDFVKIIKLVEKKYKEYFENFMKTSSK
jgi:hypothetical protein